MTIPTTAQKVDLKAWTSDDFDNQVGKSKYIQTLWSCKDGKSFGNIKLTYVGNGQVTVADDIYDFEMHSWKNPLNWARNIATTIGDPNGGKPFIIHFTGKGTLGIPWRQTDTGRKILAPFNFNSLYPHR